VSRLSDRGVAAPNHHGRCGPLLSVCRKRIEERGWTGFVEAVEMDCTAFKPEERATIVTFSYSLSMIPDFHAAVERALAEDFSVPDVLLGVADFYVSAKVRCANTAGPLPLPLPTHHPSLTAVNNAARSTDAPEPLHTAHLVAQRF
jgi:hypothetical protein